MKPDNLLLLESLFIPKYRPRLKKILLGLERGHVSYPLLREQINALQTREGKKLSIDWSTISNLFLMHEKSIRSRFEQMENGAPETWSEEKDAKYHDHLKGEERKAYFRAIEAESRTLAKKAKTSDVKRVNGISSNELKRTELRAKISKAVADLIADGQEITPTSVSLKGQLRRASVYAHKDLLL